MGSETFISGEIRATPMHSGGTPHLAPSRPGIFYTLIKITKLVSESSREVREAKSRFSDIPA